MGIARYFSDLVPNLPCSGLEQHPFTTASPITRCMPTREDQVALRKGCDLVNVGGNTTDTSHTHPLNPMTTHNDVQAEQAPCSLTDQDLQDISGGFVLPLGSDLPTSDPDSSLPSWWMFLL